MALAGVCHTADFPAGWRAVLGHIAELRHDKNMAQFRTKLRDVEEEAAADAARGNIEEVARRAYYRELADTLGRLEGLGSSLRRTAIGIVVGGGAGAATMSIPQPWGIIAGATIGAIPTTITDVRNVLRQRRSRGWVAVHQRLAQPA